MTASFMRGEYIGLALGRCARTRAGEAQKPREMDTPCSGRDADLRRRGSEAARHGHALLGARTRTRAEQGSEPVCSARGAQREEHDYER
jgi:hypothetical protein